MRTTSLFGEYHRLSLLLSWRRVVLTLCVSVAVGLVISLGWGLGILSVLFRTLLLGLFAMLAFGLTRQWPERLPSFVPRWIWQVAGVALSVPLCMFVIFVLSTEPGAPAYWKVEARLQSFVDLCLFGVPWVVLAALVQRKAEVARHQKLAFDLQRSQLERQALDARLHLLQAQIAPHFLFNTLANVQALVETGSPNAPYVLRSLISYLHAAVPRLQDPVTTFDHELQLVRAYLELMHVRMPDRLQFEVHVDETATSLYCPPMTVMTLVENAVRHGIDPSEEGGRVEIQVQRRDKRCIVQVIDTGGGLKQVGTDVGGGVGTGLWTLRERLRLIYGNDAELRLRSREEHGTVAEVDIPALNQPTNPHLPH